MEVTNLKTLYEKHPLGIDETPFFSWNLESDVPDTLQAAYEIEVTRNGETVWNSGKVKKSDTSFIVYNGKSLESKSIYEWSVTVWDNHGNERKVDSAFETGLFKKDWKAEWVKSPFKPVKSKLKFSKQGPSTLFRKSFTMEKSVKRARLHATCHGIYHVTINGVRFDDRELAPEHTSYEKYLCTQTYDVTKLLKSGANAIGFHVGNGWYVGSMNVKPGFKGYDPVHAILFQLEITYIDDSSVTVISDQSVKASHGPVLFSDFFTGEKYDANLVQKDWDTSDFDDTRWLNALKADYGYANLKAQIGSPVRPVMTIEAKRAYVSPNGENIVDFGQNLAGRIRVKIDVPKGHEITFEHTEVTDKDGNYFANLGNKLVQKVVYVSDGNPTAFEPQFIFFGFRFVRVTGIEKVDKHDFEAVVLSSDNDDAGTFECSDERLDRLYQNIRRSQRANMISIPTDCPQREKSGWTGDIQIYAKTALLNQDLSAFLTRWLDNVKCDQQHNGAIPMVVPYTAMYQTLSKIMGSLGKNKGPMGVAGWGDAAVIVPWTMYQVTKNEQILTRQYDVMKKWCGYIIESAKRKPKKSTIPEELDKYLWNTGFHYGEWLIPSYSTKGVGLEGLKSAKISAQYVAPVFGWYSITLMSKIAEILDKRQDYEYYKSISNKMENAISKGIFTKEGKMPVQLQGAYVLPLYFNLVPDEYVQSFVSTLVDMIEKNGNCLDTGFLATPYLLDVLCNYGHKDLAYKVLLQTKAPSWLYAVEKDATTIWESWYGYDENDNPLAISFNHYSFGSVADWMYRYIGGIDMESPGFEKIIIKPEPNESITHSNVSFMSVHGMIRCNWEATGSLFTMDVQIPCNTTAKIVLPDGQAFNIGSGRYSYSCNI